MIQCTVYLLLAFKCSLKYSMKLFSCKEYGLDALFDNCFFFVQKLAEVKLEVRDREEQVQEKQVKTSFELKIIPGLFYKVINRTWTYTTKTLNGLCYLA